MIANRRRPSPTRPSSENQASPASGPRLCMHSRVSITSSRSTAVAAPAVGVLLVNLLDATCYVPRERAFQTRQILTASMGQAVALNCVRGDRRHRLRQRLVVNGDGLDVVSLHGLSAAEHRLRVRDA